MCHEHILLNSLLFPQAAPIPTARDVEQSRVAPGTSENECPFSPKVFAHSAASGASCGTRMGLVHTD